MTKIFGSKKNVMSPVKVRAHSTETNVFTKENRKEWQLKSNVTSHERDTS